MWISRVEEAMSIWEYQKYISENGQKHLPLASFSGNSSDLLLTSYEISKLTKLGDNMYAKLNSEKNYINALGVEILGASYFICDSEDDVSTLPVSQSIGIGSRALVIPTGAIYMLGPSRTWIKYAGVSILN